MTIGEGLSQKKLTTRGFQDFIIGSIFGWRKKRSKVRRFREAYIQIGRQNGKSFVAGAISNDFATFSGYKFGRILIAGPKMDQSKIVWTEIKKFILSDAELAELYKIKEHENLIISKITGTEIKALSRDTTTADGFRSICSVIDEYHKHKTNQMYQLLIDGQITVNNALMLAITTAGFDLNSACYEHYLFCKKVLNRVIEKESLFVYICETDESDDIWDQKNWAKANPLYLWNADNTLNKEMLLRMSEKAIEAKEKGGDDLVNFLTKSLNRWVSVTGESYLDAEKWQACADDLTLADMKNRECYLGIDLSSGGDLTSIALVFPLDDEKCYIYSHSYLPELRLIEHERTDSAPYRIWVQEGLITLTSGLYGVKTDYKKIIVELKKMIDEYNLKVIGCGYDPHNAAGFLSDLESILECDLTEIVQSAKSLNDATVDFQLSVKGRLISYNRNDKLLSWSAMNAVLTSNSFGEVKIDKQKNSSRIDAIDAIICAWKLYFRSRENEPDGEGLLDEWLQMTD